MRYFIITFGCQMNKSDSERIAAVLEKQGYKPLKADLSADFVGRRQLRRPKAEALAKADLIVVNMCSVRQSAVDRVYGLTQKFKNLKTKKPKLKIILTGCILTKDKEKLKEKVDLILNIKDLPNWPRFLESKSVELNSEQKSYANCEYLKIQPKYQYKPIAYIPISTGCNDFCSYCAVPFTRGRLVCRPAEDILEEVKNAVKNGFREIWLLGQNVNDYNSRIDTNMNTNFTNNIRDISAKISANSRNISAEISANSREVNFAKLLKMVNDIPGDFKFFFTSPHPKNFSDESIETLASCEKFGKILNLPVQSGDDEILKKMKRNYTVKEYKDLVKKIRQKIPDIKLSTDVIVGFPGESEKQFQNTVKLFKEIKFDWAYIAKYSPRPGTAAFQMKNSVPLTEKKRRWKVLNNILHQIKK